jgi:hypothetical protein
MKGDQDMFDPSRPAQDMTCAELMCAHVAMADGDAAGDAVVKKVEDIYESLNRRSALKGQAEDDNQD